MARPGKDQGPARCWRSMGSIPFSQRLQGLYQSDKERLKLYAEVLYDQALLIEGISYGGPLCTSLRSCASFSKTYTEKYDAREVDPVNYGVYPPGGYPPPPSNGPYCRLRECTKTFPRACRLRVCVQTSPRACRLRERTKTPLKAYRLRERTRMFPRACRLRERTRMSPRACRLRERIRMPPRAWPPQGAYQNVPPGHAASGSVPKTPLRACRLRERTRMSPRACRLRERTKTPLRGMPSQGSVPKRPPGRTASRGISEFPPQGMYQTVPQGVPQNVGSPYGGVFPAGYGALPVLPAALRHGRKAPS